MKNLIFCAEPIKGNSVNEYDILKFIFSVRGAQEPSYDSWHRTSLWPNEVTGKLRNSWYKQIKDGALMASVRCGYVQMV